MNKEFLKLLEVEYEELKIGLSKASIEGKGTPQEVADRREELFHTFFEKYFPFPYRITKGNIVDSYNKRSASIDCLILDPSHPFTIDTKNKKSSIIFADGVDYAIEIKGSLNEINEIERALKQIKTVKELTRVRNGLLYAKERNEYTYKIPTILIAEKIYSNINKLIEEILNYYKVNRIKRIHQFDIMIAGDYIIINSCKGQISFNGKERGLYYGKTGNKSLAVLLYLMSYMPLVQASINENIYNLYLDNTLLDLSYRDDWNEALNNIEND